MGWFKRNKEGITTETKDKKETPEGLWHKCPKCKVIVRQEDHEATFWVCGHCEYHERIDAKEYFSFLFDDGIYQELDSKMRSKDPLEFEDTKKYKERYDSTVKKTGLNDAITTGYGLLHGQAVTIAAMNFSFIGGSMGSVVGEKISRAIQNAVKHKTPFVIISKSG